MTGHLYGNALYHVSPAPDEYWALLSASGFKVLRYQEVGSECEGHTVWLAQAGK